MDSPIVSHEANGAAAFTSVNPVSVPIPATAPLPVAPGEDSTPASLPAAPPSRKVNRSCLECTRRKVKCDGRQPCSSCVYYRTPDACGYRQRSKRNAVSRR